ncbi:MAG TPA: ABC transporter permease [Gemmatimonadales bacterium]|jgi:predicted permease
MTGDPGERGRPLPPIFESAPADEVADELRFHHDMYLRDLIARGVTADEARRLAAERLVELDRARDECHHLAQQREHGVRRSRHIVNLMQDIRFALRLLRQRPLFAAMAILPLALGIGAATTMYSVADAVLIRPLPFPHPERLVAIWATEAGFRNSAVSIAWQSVVIGQGEYDALRDRAHTLSQVAAWGNAQLELNHDGAIEEVAAVRTTASLFPLLGLHAVLGRVFRPDETQFGGPHIALLGWQAWHTTFGDDSAIVGRSIVIGDTSHYTVVGVLPPGARLDRTADAPAIWVPAFTESYDVPSQHNRSYHALGRLAAGVTVAQANVEVAGIIRDEKIGWHGSAAGTSGRAAIWQDDQTATARPSVLMLSGAVLLLLLIACVNVATLMLGDAVRRQPEMVARRALGATPARLARQLITESVVMAGVGAALGALAAWAGVRLLVHAAPAKIPGITDAHVDARVLTFTGVCALVIGVGFGLLPAFALLRWGGHSMVRIGAGQTPRRAAAMQRTLVAAEVALSLTMLVGCSLLGKSLVQLTSVNPGFVANGLFQIDMDARGIFWGDDARMARFYTAAVEALHGVPGVTAVSGSSGGLFEGGGNSSPIKVEGVVYSDSSGPPDIQQRVVLPDYLRTIGVPVLAGRDFNSSDQIGNEPVAILTRSAVRRDWGGQSPVGKRVIWQNKTWTVIGVAADIRYDQLSHDVQPTTYIPSAQWPGAGMVLTFRATADVPALEALVKARLASLDAAVTIQQVEPVRSLIRQSYAEERYRTVLGSLFGVLATILAGVGIFGVISRTVAQRMREAGIRVALGAQEPSIIALMLRGTITGALIGIVAGLALSALLAHLLTPFLFGVHAADPVAYLVAFGLLAVTMIVATLPPARRAARVDPAKILRTE